MTEQQIIDARPDIVDITDDSESESEEETPADALREALVSAGISLTDAGGETTSTGRAATAAEFLMGMLEGDYVGEGEDMPEPETVCDTCAQVVDPGTLSPMDPLARHACRANWLAEQARLDHAAAAAGVVRDPREPRTPPIIHLAAAIVAPTVRSAPVASAVLVGGTTGMVPMPQDTTYVTEDYDNFCVVDRGTDLPLSMNWGTGSVSFLCRPRPSRFGTGRWMVVTIIDNRHRVVFWDELAASYHHATDGQ